MEGVEHFTRCSLFLFPQPAVLLCPVIQSSVLTSFDVYLAVHFSLLAQRGPIRALQRWTLALLNELPTTRSRIPVKLSTCRRRSFCGATQEISLTKSPWYIPYALLSSSRAPSTIPTVAYSAPTAAATTRCLPAWPALQCRRLDSPFPQSLNNQISTALFQPYED